MPNTPNNSPRPRANDQLHNDIPVDAYRELYETATGRVSSDRDPVIQDPVHGPSVIGDNQPFEHVASLDYSALERRVATHYTSGPRAEINYYMRVRQLLEHTNPADLHGPHIMVYAHMKRWLLVEHMNVMILMYGGKFIA